MDPELLFSKTLKNGLLQKQQVKNTQEKESTQTCFVQETESEQYKQDM